jgi:inner membrane protein
MKGKTHLVFGALVATFFSQPQEWIVILIASILPDVDSSTSLLGRRAPFLGKAFEHRGFFHSLFFIVPSTIIVYSLSSSLAIAFFCGIMSHILLDMSTKQGIKLFPLKRIKGYIRVGGFREKIFFSIITCILLLRIIF